MIYFSDYMKKIFGCKVYKLSLDGSFSCPNRDGKRGTGGCIFCTGSAEFAQRVTPLSIENQIEQAKKRVVKKNANGKYIAYFGSFTSTYAPVDYLEKLYLSAIKSDNIVSLFVATRPDCLEKDVLELLEKINKRKPVAVELGLQTSDNDTAKKINRCFDTSEYVTAVRELHKRNIAVITHIIFGLPGETEEMMMKSVDFAVSTMNEDFARGEQAQSLKMLDGTKMPQQANIARGENVQSLRMSDGIKIHSLYVSKNTPLEEIYNRGEFKCLEKDEYIALVCKSLKRIPENIIIHRLTGDGDKRTLIAPEWSADKKRVLNDLNKKIREATG